MNRRCVWPAEDHDIMLSLRPPSRDPTVCGSDDEGDDMLNAVRLSPKYPRVHFQLILQHLLYWHFNRPPIPPTLGNGVYLLKHLEHNE